MIIGLGLSFTDSRFVVMVVSDLQQFQATSYMRHFDSNNVNQQSSLVLQHSGGDVQVIERYLAMYLDGLPASKATLDGLKRAFMQRKGSWQDFAVASALQLFAERDFRSQDFEREAVKWFERRAAKKVFMRHSLVGALNQTRLLWLLHGHSNFPQYSQELQQAIRGQPRVRLLTAAFIVYLGRSLPTTGACFNNSLPPAYLPIRWS